MASRFSSTWLTMRVNYNSSRDIYRLQWSNPRFENKTNQMNIKSNASHAVNSCTATDRSSKQAIYPSKLKPIVERQPAPYDICNIHPRVKSSCYLGFETSKRGQRKQRAKKGNKRKQKEITDRLTPHSARRHVPTAYSSNGWWSGMITMKQRKREKKKKKGDKANKYNRKEKKERKKNT